MKILSLDQSTQVSGWAVIYNGMPIKWGSIDLHEDTDTPHRIKNMFLQLVDVIDAENPDRLVVEAVQQQASPKTTMMLSQLQGMLIGYAYVKNISVSSPMPTEWRKMLGYQQGPKIKRAMLKQQSIDLVKDRFNVEATEDECEAICIGIAEGV